MNYASFMYNKTSILLKKLYLQIKEIGELMNDLTIYSNEELKKYKKIELKCFEGNNSYL